jgi:hypothetical protein
VSYLPRIASGKNCVGFESNGDEAVMINDPNGKLISTL